MNVGPHAQFAVTEDLVHRMAEELGETASHPEFVQMIQAVQRAPILEKQSVAEDVARVERVSSRGIPVPETFRITTRTFEDPRDPEYGPPNVTFDGHIGSVAYQGAVVRVREKGRSPEPISSDLVKTEITKGIEEIGAFVTSPAFQSVLGELAELEEEARPQFVADELLEPSRRAQRDLVVPDGMHIQRSQFADGRPTLFCVSKVLPLAYPWQKVTITFDNA